MSRKPTEGHVIALINLLHAMDGASAGRPAMELDLRARRIVQTLGLAGPATIAAVGRRLGLHPSTMTGLVDRLEQRGYVRRRSHPGDRRATVLELTAKGKRLFAEETEFYRRLIDRTLSGLDDPIQRQILAALESLPTPDLEVAPG